MGKLQFQKNPIQCLNSREKVSFPSPKTETRSAKRRKKELEIERAVALSDRNILFERRT